MRPHPLKERSLDSVVSKSGSAPPIGEREWEFTFETGRQKKAGTDAQVRMYFVYGSQFFVFGVNRDSGF